MFCSSASDKSEARRQAWFKPYIATLLQRDVRDLANIEGLRDLPRLPSILAARAGGLLNYAEISRSSTLPQTTLKRYAALLEAIFLIEPLAAWSGSLTKRLMKTPKLFFTDTGMLCHPQGLTGSRIKLEPTLAETVVENFVVGELRKQTEWSRKQANLFHFRPQTDTEVDIVMETGGGKVVGIEIKAGASVGAEAFKGLRILESELGGKFKRGIVLYAGEKSVSFGEKMFALPLHSL